MKTIRLKKSKFAILTESNVKNSVPTEQGIYLLWSKRGLKDWVCIGVEPSKNLQQDLMNRFFTESTTTPSKKVNTILGYEWALVGV